MQYILHVITPERRRCKLPASNALHAKELAERLRERGLRVLEEIGLAR